MSFFISEAYANTAPVNAQSPWVTIVMMGGFAVIFYFMLLRPQLKRQKEHKSLVDSLQKGDEIVFAGGLIGRITKLEDDFAVVELTAGVDIKIQRSSVLATLPKGTLKNI